MRKKKTTLSKDTLRLMIIIALAASLLSTIIIVPLTSKAINVQKETSLSPVIARPVASTEKPIFMSVSRKSNTVGQVVSGAQETSIDIFIKSTFGKENFQRSHDIGDSYVDAFLKEYVSIVKKANNDKYPDVAVSSNPNTLKVFSGKTGNLLWQKTIPEGINNMHSIGDINGDGYSDVGVFIEDLGAQGTDGIQIYKGNDGTFIGKISNAERDFGVAFGSLSDVTGDGREELIVGRPRNGEGRIDLYQFSGNPGSGSFILIDSIQGTVSNEGMGHGTVQEIGDVNGDGISDFYNGLTWNEEEITIYSYINANLIELQKIAVNAYSNYNSASAADVDGDGKKELLISYIPTGGVTGGRIEIYDQDLTTVVASIDDEVTPGVGNVGFFGKAMLNIGDITNDGKDEVAISQYAQSGSYTPEFDGEEARGAGGIFIWDVENNKMLQRYYGYEDYRGYGFRLAKIE